MWKDVDIHKEYNDDQLLDKSLVRDNVIVTLLV